MRFPSAPRPGPATLPPRSLELVVAHHSESLAWLRRVPPSFRVTVYDKGGGCEGLLEPLPQPRPQRGLAPQRRERHSLPNVGREAHTYLKHIVARLDSLSDPLSDLTVFCQGRPFDHAFDFHATLRGLALGHTLPDEWLWLGHTIDTESREGALFRAWSKNPTGGGLDMDGFHIALQGCELQGCEGPAEYAFVLGGQFAASRGRLERRGLEFWRRALDLSARWPEAAHCFERAWDRVVGAPGPSAELMAGRRTVHLKPMRGQGEHQPGWEDGEGVGRG